jgi:oxygen-independent coproporphyrinogen-3 oxidase
MTGLRTIWGISEDFLENNFGLKYKNHFLEKSKNFIKSGHLKNENKTFKTTVDGMFLADGIATEFFIINLGN